MAAYSAIKAVHHVLAAGVADTITLSAGTWIDEIWVINRDATAEIFFNIGTGNAATVAGDNCYIVRPNSSFRIDSTDALPVVISVISSGTPAYSVEVN